MTQPHLTGHPNLLAEYRVMADNWWTFLVRGIVAIMFGALAASTPGLTLLLLAAAFATFSIIEGIAMIIFGFNGRKHGAPFWAMLLLGVIGIGAGITAITMPGLTLVILLTVVAIWCIVRGVLEIVAGIRLRKVIDHEWALIAGGIISIAFGVLLLMRPESGLLVMAWAIAIFAVMHGIVLIMVAVRLRKVDQAFEEREAQATHAPTATA